MEAEIKNEILTRTRELYELLDKTEFDESLKSLANELDTSLRVFARKLSNANTADCKNGEVLEKFKIELSSCKTNTYGYSEYSLDKRVYKNSLKSVINYLKKEGEEITEKEIKDLKEGKGVCISSYFGVYSIKPMRTKRD